ncbi:MAG: hypothetical protein ACFE8G_01105 [Candidatus Hermodarchaeota archaeon]
MIFYEYHPDMDMMMDWNSKIWFYVLIGLIALVLLTIVIIYLMNRSTRRENSKTIIDRPTSEATINREYTESINKFCPGCGEKIIDATGKYCPICGIQI